MKMCKSVIERKMFKICPTFAPVPNLRNEPIVEEIDITKQEPVKPINYGLIVYNLIFKKQSGDIHNLVKECLARPKLYYYLRDLTRPYMDEIYKEFFPGNQIDIDKSITSKSMHKYLKERDCKLSVNGISNKFCRVCRIMEYINQYIIKKPEYNFHPYNCDGNTKFYVYNESSSNDYTKKIFDRAMNWSLPSFFSDYGSWKNQSKKYWNYEQLCNQDKNIIWIVDDMVQKIWYERYVNSGGYYSC